MIISFIAQVFLSGLEFLFMILPEVDELPFGLDSTLVSGVGIFRSFMEFFPPFETVLVAFSIYLGFRILMSVVRFILGSNSPTVT